MRKGIFWKKNLQKKQNKEKYSNTRYIPKDTTENEYNLIQKEEKLNGIIRKIIHERFLISLDELRNLMNIDKKTFDNRIIDWALEYGFVIDGDYIIIKDSELEDFINNLDSQFKNWMSKTKKKGK